jgi:hypothetical protein
MSAILRNAGMEKIVWAIDLAQKNLVTFTERESWKLKQEIFKFLTAQVEWSRGLRVRRLTNVGIVRLAHLIEEAPDLLDKETLRKIYSGDELSKLNALVDKNQKEWRRLLTTEDVSLIPKALRDMLNWIQTEEYKDFLDFEYPPVPEPSSGTGLSEILANFVVRRFQLYLLSAGIDKAQIGTCSECQRIFLSKILPREGRTYYCSHRCAQLVAARAWKQRNESKVRAYDRRRKRKSHVKVTRRPRPVKSPPPQD